MFVLLQHVDTDLEMHSFINEASLNMSSDIFYLQMENHFVALIVQLLNVHANQHYSEIVIEYWLFLWKSFLVQIMILLITTMGNLRVQTSSKAQQVPQIHQIQSFIWILHQIAQTRISKCVRSSMNCFSQY